MKQLMHEIAENLPFILIIIFMMFMGTQILECGKKELEYKHIENIERIKCETKNEK